MTEISANARRLYTHAGTHLVLLVVVGDDRVLAKRHSATDGLLLAHDQPQQCALAAAIGTCNASLSMALRRNIEAGPKQKEQHLIAVALRWKA